MDSLHCSLRLSAFFSYDVGSCLHTTYIIRVVKCLAVVWLSLLIALGWPHLHVPVPKVLSGLTSVDTVRGRFAVEDDIISKGYCTLSFIYNLTFPLCNACQSSLL